MLAFAFQTVNRAEIGDVVILDADNNSVESPFDDLNNLPQDVVGFLILVVLLTWKSSDYFFEETTEKQVGRIGRLGPQGVSKGSGATDWRLQGRVKVSARPESQFWRGTFHWNETG